MTLLLTTVLADPFDDLPRLVYADWLDENGEPERAEFIRLQIELFNYQGEREWLENMPLSAWTGDEKKRDLLESLEPLVKRHTELCKLHVLNCAKWSKEFAVSVFGENWLQLSANIYWGWSRGFIDEIRCTIREWIGGERTCPDCEGRGFLYGDYGHITSTDEGICPTCNGNTTIQTPSIAKAVCEQWPVTVVTLIDATLWNETSEYCFWDSGFWKQSGGGNIHSQLFALMGELFPKAKRSFYSTQRQHNLSFRSRAEALAALSHAALTLGRRAAGLPDIQFINHK